MEVSAGSAGLEIFMGFVLLAILWWLIGHAGI